MSAVPALVTSQQQFQTGGGKVACRLQGLPSLSLLPPLPASITFSVPRLSCARQHCSGRRQWAWAACRLGSWPSVLGLPCWGPFQ